MDSEVGSGASPTGSPARVAKWKRTRSGCLPCRRRKRKCDGQRPKCRRCTTRNFPCSWGINISFHPSRSLELSESDTAALTAIDRRRRLGGTPTPTGDRFIFVNDTEEIRREFEGQPDVAASPGGPSEDEGEEGDEPGWTTCSQHTPRPENGTHFGFGGHGEDALSSTIPGASGPADRQNGRPLGSTGLLPLDVSMMLMAEDLMSTDPQVPIAPFSLGQAISRGVCPQPDPPLPVTHRTQVHLMTAFIRETATWCETTDTEMHFSTKCIHELMGSKPFVSAAMALASRQLDTIQKRPRQMTLELYQHTISLLLRQNPVDADASILATCTLLCVYEMMASDVADWRRHLRGCASLLSMGKWNGSSEGIIKACFWAFARIDVWAAFSLDQTTLIPTHSWVWDESVESVAANGGLDNYCNLTLLFFARAINLLNDDHGESGRGRHISAESARRLWDSLQLWRRCRPQRAMPLLRSAPCRGRPFPTLVFTQSSPICGNTFYHAACLLLLRTGEIQHGEGLNETEVMSPVWHAREIGGVSISNDSHANWVNHLQPLYIAGCAFASPRRSGPSGESDSMRGHSPAPEAVTGELTVSGHGGELEEFAEEKIALLRHLSNIQHETGWKTWDRAKDLRVLWGLEF